MNYFNIDPQYKAREKRAGLIGIIIGGLIGVVGALLQLAALNVWDWTVIFAVGFSALVFGMVGWVVGSLWFRRRPYHPSEPKLPRVKTTEPGRCVMCGKQLRERTAQALFTPGMAISDNTTYPCKSCGAIYCLDCMSKLKTINQPVCIRCHQPHGW